MSHDELRKIAEGLEAEIFAYPYAKTVLRLLRDPEAGVTNQRQAIAMQAARDAGVLVPPVLGVTTVMGRPGIVMQRVEGRDLMAELGRRPWRLFWVARVSGEVHAQLHGVPGPEHIIDLLAKLYREIHDSNLVPAEIKEYALDKLEGLPAGDRLCHGDFYPANLLLSPQGPALIDWTHVARGDPAADVARTLLMVRLGELPPSTPMLVRPIAAFARGILAAAYLRAYRRKRVLDADLVDRWEIPVAAARLAQGIEGERLSLLKLLSRPTRDPAAPQLL